MLLTKMAPAKTRVSAKGQVVLPKAVRERRNWPAGTELKVEETPEGVTRLTVVHDGFASGSVVLPNIAQGWPAVFSSLKSLLETGSPLP